MSSKADEEFMKGIRYVEEDGKTFTERDKPICDFCLGDPDERPITWSYPAEDMPVNPENPAGSMSAGEWGACDGCHELIEKEDFDTLFERTFEQQISRFLKQDPVEAAKRNPLGKAKMKQEAMLIWMRFLAARTGPAVPESES